MDNSDISNVLITSDEIDKRVKELGKEITEDYSGMNPLFVGTLKGAVIFTADLIREIKTACELDFISVSSYDKSESTGIVTINSETKMPLVGRNVIIVEDIVDTGKTLLSLKQRFKDLGAKSVKIVSLLNKPSHRIIDDLDVEYIGFDIPDEFIVGYGLDFDEKYRNLPDICVLDESAYQ